MARTLPDGTVTLVFTDIAGSTELLQRLGEEYRTLLEAHRALVRDVVVRHHGVEVDTQGDSFFLVFRRAADAVNAARELTAACAEAGPLRIRIGIHTGEPALTAEGYVGIDVHRAARIGAAGHGGQILLSQQTRDLARHDGLHDLGDHRLKDVGVIHLYQVGDEAFPPVRSIGATNLSPAGRLLGRDRERGELERLLLSDGRRLITITGPGGIGKTTIVRSAAAAVAAQFVDGCWFADLSPLDGDDQVERQVAASLGAPGAVVDYLRSRRLLLVLDNFEHVLPAAGLVSGWLEACPRLQVLVTSRERLHLRDELEYPLAPLAPEAAVALFRDRAQAALPGFDGDDGTIAELCARLDGMPLAIELAAARVRLLTPDQLLERLDGRLALLTGGTRDAPARQRTLEATIDWSYQLLEASERELFARLAVFSGGWSLDAAEHVCDAGLDPLQALAEKHLIQSGQGRFRMLETIHAYADARLAALAGGGDLRRRHARYYAAQAGSIEPGLTGPEQERALELMAVEYDNLRAAMEWSEHDPQSAGDGLAIAAALVLYWYLRGMYVEGMSWIERLRAVARAGDESVDLRALWGFGFFASVLHDARGEAALEQSLAAAGRIGDRSMVARSLNLLGLQAFIRDDMAVACRSLEASIAESRTAGDAWCLVDALGTIGSLYPLLGRNEDARVASGESLAIARSRGDLQGMRMALLGLSLAARRSDDPSLARPLAQEGFDVSGRLGDAFFMSYFLWILSTVDRLGGDRTLAAGEAAEALRLAREVHVPFLIACALEAGGAAAHAKGDVPAATVSLEESIAIGRGGGVPGAYVAEALQSLASLEAERGQVEAARTLLEEALTRARLVSDTWGAGRARDGLAALASAGAG